MTYTYFEIQLGLCVLVVLLSLFFSWITLEPIRGTIVSMISLLACPMISNIAKEVIGDDLTLPIMFVSIVFTASLIVSLRDLWRWWNGENLENS